MGADCEREERRGDRHGDDAVHAVHEIRHAPE